MGSRVKTLMLAILGVAVLAICVYGGYAYFKNPLGPKQHSKSSLYHGIDISHHQGKIDWEQLAQDTAVQFAYIKATEGTTWRDERFHQNVNGARKNGIKVGAYHLLSLTSSPETQVENFCQMVFKEDVDLIPALDIETTLVEHENRDCLEAYAKRVSELMTERFGVKPLIYTSSSVYNYHLYPDFKDHYLWISNYGDICPQLVGETMPHIWQYSKDGYTQVYNRKLDLNRFVNGTTIEDILLDKDM